MIRSLAIIGLYISIVFGQGQRVCPGANCFPTKEECVQARAANIDLTGKRRLQGTVHDPSGAPFLSPVVVELRDPATGKPLVFTSFDSDGHFEFDGLNYGPVNWTLALMKDGKPTITGFIMPNQISCGNGDSCEVRLLLKVARTDTPKYMCPLE